MRTGTKPLLATLLVLLAQAAWGAFGLQLALHKSRIKGGLCVIVGGSDARLATEVARSGSFFVQCLFLEPATVGPAREALLKERLYGQVTVEAWPGQSLPYADNLVSLLIVLDAGRVGEAELLRVLRPFGEMIVAQGDKSRFVTKPMAEGMDEWTHWRHGEDRNPVSNDKLVDVPERIQWLFPVKTVTERSHFIVANGRAFAQDRDLIIARDAGNGLPLWKTKIKVGKEFDWEYSVKVAALIASRGERVYALTEDSKLKALDAATGQPVMVYDQADVPFDIIVADDGATLHGTIVVLCTNSVRALDAGSGSLLWKQEAVWPHNLIVSRDAAFFIEGNDRHGGTNGVLFARGLRKGELLWKRDYYWARRTELGGFGFDHLVYEVRPPFNWRTFYEERPEEKKQDNYRLVVVSAKTGQEVQRLERVGSSARHGEFFRGFWYKEQLLIETQTREGLGIGLFSLSDFSKPATVFKANYVGDKGWGHCYPPVLTERYYINGQLNFTDLRTRRQVSNQITRGACNTSREGYIPAYGMIYTFPKHCVCFPMLDGNVCLAPASPVPPPETADFQHGPAWPAKPETVDYSKEWPSFRHDAWRSGGTDETVPAKLAVLWQADVEGPDYKDPLAAEWLENPFTAGPVTAPVAAGGMVYVAQSDTHRLVALDAKNGQQRWQFVADGRVDGPPTLHQGMCLFGCRDGWIYNLRASDGALTWKLRLAPHERRVSIYGQLESPWAVPGSVLVADGLGYVCGGLHPNADGGVRVVCFRPDSGEVVWKNKFDSLGMGDPWPAPYQPGLDRDPWRSIFPKEYRYFDLLVRDGESVAVSRCLFDLKTGKADLRKTSGSYFVAETGAYLPRTAWNYGNVRNFSPVAVSRAGAVFSSVPGIAKLFRADFVKGAPFDTDWVTVSKEQTDSGMWTATSRFLEKGAKWAVDSEETKVAFNRAMLVAGEHLFTVTPKGQITIHRTADGQRVGELRLDTPARDGMAAAGGRLFVSTVTGKVVCLAPSP
jgi:outer membrane protein assembly factor BamB